MLEVALCSEDMKYSGPFESYGISDEGVCGMSPWVIREINIAYPESFLPKEKLIMGSAALSSLRAQQILQFLAKQFPWKTPKKSV